MNTFEIIVRYHRAFASGLLVTVKLAAVVWTAGLSAGLILGIVGAGHPKTFGRLIALGSFLLSGLPLLVLLFWLHYPLQVMFDVVIDPFITACLALGIANAFGVAQAVRNALGDFPSQYAMAAKVTGLTTRETFIHVKGPILLRQLLPVLLTLQVAMLQATLFASLISVEELFKVAQRVNSMIYKPIEIYSALGLFFLLVCLPLNGLALWLKARFTRNHSES
jgi:His/Glu/Gln/Arg/opine family amino acid ABC transporter permease subunit